MNDKIQNELAEIKSDFELVSILFLSHGDGGAHLLFKYPFSNTAKFTGLKVLIGTGGKACFTWFFLFFCFKVNKRNPYSMTSSDYLNFWIIDK
jgi:hypothetical protein